MESRPLMYDLGLHDHMIMIETLIPVTINS